MHPRTVATLEKLDRADWFSAVGSRDTEAAIVAGSWQEAVEHCGSIEWENLCLEAANSFRERLFERSRERFSLWNEIVEEIRPTVIQLVDQKIADVVHEYDLPEVFGNTVRWDILHLCMEAEYADVYPPAFYASQAYWYVKGHFPCGWQGNFPEGKLIVY